MTTAGGASGKRQRPLHRAKGAVPLPRGGGASGEELLGRVVI